MDERHYVTFLRVCAREGDFSQLSRGGVHYGKIAKMYGHAISAGHIEVRDQGITLTLAGEEHIKDFERSGEGARQRWVDPDFSAEIPAMGKLDIYLPRPGNVDFDS